MKERKYLFQETIAECGCRIVVWSEGDELHFGPTCARCAAMVTSVCKKLWPGIPVTEVPA